MYSTYHPVRLKPDLVPVHEASLHEKFDGSFKSVHEHDRLPRRSGESRFDVGSAHLQDGDVVVGQRLGRKDGCEGTFERKILRRKPMSLNHQRERRVRTIMDGVIEHPAPRNAVSSLPTY